MLEICINVFFIISIFVYAETASHKTEGGMYISPEFQLGQVYDGTGTHDEDIILYRPVYVCVPHEKIEVTNIHNFNDTTVNSEGKVSLKSKRSGREEKMTSV